MVSRVTAAAGKAFALLCVAGGFGLTNAQAENRYESSSDFVKYAMKLRENALLRVEPQVVVPTSRGSNRDIGISTNTKYPWKRNIVTTVFWVGELPTKNNPVPNTKSSWDQNWMRSFGGYDDPDKSARSGFRPAKFTPRQNPFYVALPYNDVTRGQTKPEASRVIPWFRQAFVRSGQSVCKGRWARETAYVMRSGRIADPSAPIIISMYSVMRVRFLI
jgi:hypothetical protein